MDVWQIGDEIPLEVWEDTIPVIAIHSL